MIEGKRKSGKETKWKQVERDIIAGPKFGDALGRLYTKQIKEIILKERRTEEDYPPELFQDPNLLAKLPAEERDYLTNVSDEAAMGWAARHDKKATAMFLRDEEKTGAFKIYDKEYAKRFWESFNEKQAR